MTKYSQYSTAQPAPRWGTLAAVAAGLAAAALYVNAKARQAEAENPPRGKFVEVDGVRLHYVDHGTGDALVLLHGNGITASDFEASSLLDRAGEHQRVIAFDRPGFGHSERPRTTLWTPEAQARLLHKALKLLGIERPVVVGHSWGTLVALAMALDYPDDVRGLVLLSGYYYPSVRLDVPLLSPPAIPVVGDILRHTVTPLLARALWPLLSKRIFSPAEVPERFQRLPVWMMLRPSQLRASAADTALMIPAAMRLNKRYEELSVPVQIIAGDSDKIVTPKAHSGRLDDAVAAGTIQMEEGQGHMVHYFRVDDILAAIDTVRSTPQRGMINASYVVGHA
ncbi:MAG: alpha/beta hydrolase [Gammaproteobacteria bacterium]